jgi:hypothetical protein
VRIATSDLFKAALLRTGEARIVRIPKWLNEKKLYQKVELSGGSDGARTFMIGTSRIPFMGCTSSKKSLTQCYWHLPSKSKRGTLYHAHESQGIGGKKWFNAIRTVRVCVY